MKKNILVPIEYTEEVTSIDENGNEVTEEVTKVRYEPQNVDMSAEEIAQIETVPQPSAEERKEELLSQIAELYKQYSDIDNEVSV